ncbi:MAG: hypothetical protein R3A51_00190 [Nannocystaceae bacterium]
MNEREKLDARLLISDDLAVLQRERRRHFAPALALVIIALTVLVLLLGIRPDMFDQPWWQLTLQGVVWVQCLLILPAIGLGLLFPGRGVKLVVALAAVVTTFFAAVGLPGPFPGFSALLEHAFGRGVGCISFVFAAGAGLLLIGHFSGAFAQRRRREAVLWITAGITMAVVDAITWHCPASDPLHTLSTHIGTALVVLAFASATAALAHTRRLRASEQS